MISPGARRAVFLDKDGTLVEDVPYNVDPRKLLLTPNAGPALRRFADAGFLLIVVSNQSGVARGLFPAEALDGVEQGLQRLLAPFGVRLTDFVFCPHHPEGELAPYDVECECRKPRPGMLLQAAERHGIDLSASWLIGDILDDVEAGCRAGCRTVLLNRVDGNGRAPSAGTPPGEAISGGTRPVETRPVETRSGETRSGETEWRAGPCRSPDAIVADLGESADLIVMDRPAEEEGRCEEILSN